jgi:hypothetical protein
MKKIIFTLAFVLIAIPFAGASAQMMYGAPQNASGSYPYGMMGYPAYGTSTNSTALDAGEATGQAIAQKLQAKTLACADLSQDNYESLGDFYMGLMMGSSHDSMEQYIEKSYGADYLKSMHIAMGERFSGCNVNVSFPAGMMGFGPMMGGWSNGSGNWSGYSMMDWGFPGMMSGYYGGHAWFGWITMILVWVLLVLGIVAVVKWLKK